MEFYNKQIMKGLMLKIFSSKLFAFTTNFTINR